MTSLRKEKAPLEKPKKLKTNSKLQKKATPNPQIHN